jgi:hypothetical protein
MKRLLLSALLLCPLLCIGETQTLAEKYSDRGQLIVGQFASAPFPHPKRSEGHKYHEENYSAAEHYSDSTVAIFIPKNFHEDGPVDFVIHFHGWRNNVAGTLSKYKLIEQLMESKRNAILVVPEGPKDAPDSFGGKLEDEGGFRRFMVEVVETLKAKSNLKKKDVVVGKIVLSGHSGGYQVISSIVDRGGITDHVKEVWLFDALYAQTDKFLAWFDKEKGRLLNIYTEHGGTKKETEQMMATLKAKGISVVAGTESQMKVSELPKSGAVFIFSDLEHDDVVDKHSTFRDFLMTSNLKEIGTSGHVSTSKH